MAPKTKRKRSKPGFMFVCCCCIFLSHRCRRSGFSCPTEKQRLIKRNKRTKQKKEQKINKQKAQENIKLSPHLREKATAIKQTNKKSKKGQARERGGEGEGWVGEGAAREGGGGGVDTMQTKDVSRITQEGVNLTDFVRVKGAIRRTNRSQRAFFGDSSESHAQAKCKGKRSGLWT